MGATKPNFLIVGAAKTGTTSLFHYLNEHPDIFIPERKECRFFSEMPGNFNGIGADYQNDVVKSFEDYQKLFEPGASKKSRGDISNDYLYYYNKSIKNIKKYLGDDVKIIITLRNPVERAYSNYLHHVNSGWEKLTFEEALIAETSRRKENWAWPWFYQDTGLYFYQVKAYLDNFQNVKIFLYEDILNTRKFLTDIYTFLLVEPNIIVNTEKVYHKAGKPIFGTLQNLIKLDHPIKRTFSPIVKGVLSPEMRDKIKGSILALNQRHQKKALNNYTRLFLVEQFKDNVEKLEKLIERDLSSWVK